MPMTKKHLEVVADGIRIMSRQLKLNDLDTLRAAVAMAEEVKGEVGRDVNGNSRFDIERFVTRATEFGNIKVRDLAVDDYDLNKGSLAHRLIQLNYPGMQRRFEAAGLQELYRTVTL